MLDGFDERSQLVSLKTPFTKFYGMPFLMLVWYIDIEMGRIELCWLGNLADLFRGAHHGHGIW